MSDTVLSQGHETLTRYVKRVRFGNRINSNTIREQLSNVSGLRPSQFGGIVNRAVRRGLITRVGTTKSTQNGHNSGEVGVYIRG